MPRGSGLKVIGPSRESDPEGSRSAGPSPERFFVFFFFFSVPRVNGRSSGRGKGRAGSGCLGNFPAA